MRDLSERLDVIRRTDGITDFWYIVARSDNDEAISIDCNPHRIGLCYEGFWDTHGLAGSCPIVALSFTELLRRLYDCRGGYWYWLATTWVGYGDAPQTVRG